MIVVIIISRFINTYKILLNKISMMMLMMMMAMTVMIMHMLVAAVLSR